METPGLGGKNEKVVETTFSTVPTITGENVTTKALNLNLGKNENIANQVKVFISENLSKIKESQKLVIPGQAHAAGSFLALGEMLWGLPKKAELIIPGFPPTDIDLSEWRHQVARKARAQRIEGEKSNKVFILQGGHPIDKGQYEAIAKSMGVLAEDIVAVPFGDNKITSEEIVGNGKNKIITALVEAAKKVNMTVGDWESGKVLYAPAGLGALSILQNCAIYGISGQWPNMIRLASNPETKQFEFAETINLQSLRQEGKNIEELKIARIKKEDIEALLKLTKEKFGDSEEYKKIASYL